MKALCWHGKGDMRYETVPDPRIEDPRDAIIKVTAFAICGSDLHIYQGRAATTRGARWISAAITLPLTAMSADRV